MSHKVTVEAAICRLKSALLRPSIRRVVFTKLQSLLDTFRNEVETDQNYDRKCSVCKHAKIHHTNETGICTSCTVNLRK